MNKYDVIIIGGGAVGCAVAYTLRQYDLSVALLERNPDVAMGTSGKNSGVVHAGFNNAPGSLMAKLCVQGNKEFEALCRTLDVPYKRTGKLVVAFDESDMDILHRLIAASEKNGCVGISLIGREQMLELEPNIGGIAAMYSSNTAVFDPFLYTINLCEAAIGNGAEFFMNQEVQSIRRDADGFVVSTPKDEFRCTMLVNAAGLYSDKVAAMAGHPGYTIYPCRGQYLILDKLVETLVSRPVYPAPRKGVGGLGVHLTSSITGSVLVGPSAEYLDDKEEYATTADVIEKLFSEAQQLLPLLTRGMVIGSYTGIRSKLVAKGQKNFGDFIVEESGMVENLINLIGIESPGITASIPIARMVAELIGSKIPLRENPRFVREYHAPVRFHELSTEEQDRLIAEDPNFGEMICRCEHVTKAEVIRALHNPLGAHSLMSVKNRLHTMMGRCQGGYCMTRIVEIIMQEFGIGAEAIDYRHESDHPFLGVVR